MTDELRPHDSIRRALSERLGRSRALSDAAQCASALAVAAHPWPDEEVDSELLEKLLGELDPHANLPHRDIREVAVDRLYRLIDVCADYGEAGARLTDWYQASLSELEDQLAELPTPVPVDAALAVVVKPSVSLESEWETTETASGDEEGAEGGGAAASIPPRALSEFLYKVAEEGTSDLGLLLGHEPTGIEVGKLITFSTDRAVLLELDEFFSELDDRSKGVIMARPRFGGGKATLEDLGDRWGVTRERIRQIEQKVFRRISKRFSLRLEEACVAINFLRGRAARTEGIVAAAKTLATGLENQVLVADCLLEAAGPWERLGEWMVHESACSSLPRSKEDVSAHADEHLLLSAEEMRALFRPLFLSDVSWLRYAIEHLKMDRIDDVWMLRPSRSRRVIAALRVIGRPATKGEIAVVAGVDIQNDLSLEESSSLVGSYLSSETGVVRADKIRWGFSAWIDQPYEGIAQEIGRLVDKNGGQCSISVIRERLIGDLGASAETVESYLCSYAFDWDVQGVRRSSAPYRASDPALIRGAVCCEQIWGQKVVVKQIHLKGFSFNVDQDVAHANGVRIDDKLLLKLNGGEEDVSVIWDRAKLGRAVSVGRMKTYLEQNGMKAGDELIIFPTRDRVLVKNVDEVS